MPRHNNFDALRVFAAFLVIYGHGCELTGGRDPGLWGVPLARIGLDIFFSISGYLVTTSWQNDPRLRDFALKRALRILPGLAACVLLTAFAMGPAVTTLPLAAYLSDPGTHAYLANAALYAVQTLPGVFETLHVPRVVNGSLWSLFPEVLCYLTVPLFALLAPRARLPALLAVALASGGIGVLLFLSPSPSPVIYGAALHYLLVQVPFFLVGGALALLRHRPGLLCRPDLCLLFLTMNYGISSWYGWWSLPVEWLTMPYLVISFGLLSLPGLNQAARLGDLSYGLYLYAFPVQQLVLLLWPAASMPILLCVLVTAALAFLSWHLVEKPALRLKPGRPRPAAAVPSLA